jgi:hypothetical protein
MIWPAHHGLPAPAQEGWTVEIQMPVFDSGRDLGNPVGWLNMNEWRRTGGVRAAIKHWKVSQMWRRAAYQALIRHGVPAELGRVYVEVGFRFPDRRRRDLANYEPTVKACIDALQPTRTYVRKGKLVVEPGVGVVRGDDRRYLIRGPEKDPGPPLGPTSKTKGVVILTIVPFPPEGAHP